VKFILSVPVMVFLTASAHAALPGDGADGKRLHDANCMGCHDTAVYTRKDHLVRSLDGLKQQFESCSHMAKKEFSPTEAQNILKYLNDQFYRFQ
jgi:hypothetical protein